MNWAAQPKVELHLHVEGAAPPELIFAGGTRGYQAWMRDVTCGPPPSPCPTPCGMGSNLSNAVRVTLVP